ncbi:MAG: sigma-54-dependent Fis family transcriptional regulator [Chitinophagales bacterium]|nr:sigma-54-dependent Fis family transcriptional regulator [Chitinophagales bacterium]HAE14218.1 sigma-54-dependent Fis family transcriptional regulator [Bacteroidota bacterium]MCB9019114.1 sigma-54-dependent Fis family transcriptional regulator [Chitinophagales bacterium]MCB9021877.1 sigma-54-dependent Fis family transcriptional regulator [Chitinophagales bacterium]MCB9030872.1 sigma-54-dependent Fis family transcriptional regulator [Chitinophagales bacterium]
MADEIRSIKQRFGIIGNAPGLNYALSIAARVAPTNLTVLITGESGVGKEIFSQVIHQNSPRKHGPFIAVNCGAIPEGTIDSELFGHVKGSFTNAVDDRKGYFETVNGGTIFLDEIGEMPLGTQARLLRVLETGEFIRVGSSKVQKTDVRVVAATNVDLHQLIQTGRFREDLFYRLNTVPIRVPALRERHDDIYLLFRKFSSDFAEKYRTPLVQLDDAAVQLLSSYNWPGNIRELKNVAEQVSVLSGQQTVSAGDLRAFLPDVQRTSLPMLRQEAEQHSASFTEREIFYKVLYDMKKDLNDLKQFVLTMAEANELKTDSGAVSGLMEERPVAALLPMEHKNQQAPVVIEQGSKTTYPIEQQVEENLSLADKEKELIIKALKKHKGKRRDAALDLGISERTLYRKIKEYELE